MSFSKKRKPTPSGSGGLFACYHKRITTLKKGKPEVTLEVVTTLLSVAPMAHAEPTETTETQANSDDDNSSDDDASSVGSVKEASTFNSETHVAHFIEILEAFYARV